MTLFGDRPYTLDRVVRLALTLGAAWGGVVLLDYLSEVLLPFMVAVLLAYILHPLVSWVQQRVRSRALAVWLTLVGTGALLGGLLVIFLPLMGREIAHMGSLISDLVNNSGLAEQAARRLPPDIWLWVREQLVRPEMQSFFQTDSVLTLVQALSKKLVPGLWNIIAGTASLLLWMVGLVFILMYLVFLLLDFQRFKDSSRDLVPASWREPLTGFLHDFDAGMSRYFRAQAGVAAIVGVLFALGFSLIGLPLSILLGLFIGLLNMVPYLQTLGLVPAFFLAGIHALETGTDFGLVFGLTGLVFLVVQALQDMFLVPRIMGKVMGLSPAMILLSLSVWGKLLGFLGLIIALPITCLLLAYYKRIILNQRDCLHHQVTTARHAG
ncbi:MAG: AI-2E family transporter [Deltaproteobacteria bacterium]|nr:MAG: AI-2E family transporter [Deltaproteobacteria bacterium]